MSLKLYKLLLGGVVIGAGAALAATYYKKYTELAPAAPEGEGGEGNRSYVKVDKDVAVEAAKQTAETIKEGAVKAWGVAKDSAKAVGDIVMDNYGDSINATKEKAGNAYNTVKGKFEEAKEAATEKFNEFKEANPEVFEKVEEFKESAKEKFDDLTERFKKVTEEAEEGCCAEETG